MTSQVLVDLCAACATQLFPRRLACPACGSDDLRPHEAGAGVVAHVTTVHRSPGSGAIPESGRPRLGLVALGSGVFLIARCEAEVLPGTPVELTREEDGAVVARRRQA